MRRSAARSSDLGLVVDISLLDGLIAGWFVLASALAVFMVRKGHNGARWTILAFLLGPLAVPLALRARHRAASWRPKRLADLPAAASGPRVLVGLDGSAQALDALRASLLMIGDGTGRLTLAHVADFETAAGDPESTALSTAERILDEGAAIVKLKGLEPVTVVLAGEPATALVEHAIENDDELIVVGTHGRGESAWLLGNVAAALTKRGTVPVVILSGGTVHRSATG